MSEERHYSAEHGYDDAISVVGDGDCKLASFSRPQNSQEEEWFAYGSDEDEDAIANLAVYMRDELRNCIVEMDRVKAINKELLDQLTDMHLLQAKGYELANESIRLKTSNSDLLAALKSAKQFIQNGIQYGYINMPDKDCGDSALETPAKIEAAIQKERGQE